MKYAVSFVLVLLVIGWVSQIDGRIAHTIQRDLFEETWEKHYAVDPCGKAVKNNRDLMFYAGRTGGASLASYHFRTRIDEGDIQEAWSKFKAQPMKRFVPDWMLRIALDDHVMWGYQVQIARTMQHHIRAYVELSCAKISQQTWDAEAAAALKKAVWSEVSKDGDRGLVWYYGANFNNLRLDTWYDRALTDIAREFDELAQTLSSIEKAYCLQAMAEGFSGLSCMAVYRP